MGYAICQTSLGHTYGNITCFVADYVKSLFPKNYFKTIHISSSIAYRQFDIFKNTSKEFLKKRPPMLIIRPRVELTDSDTFLNGTYLTTRIMDNYMDTSYTNLQPFIEDTEKGIYLKFLLNRLRMSFEVLIVTDTMMEQLNQANFLKNRVRQDRPFFLSTSLESFVPREMIELLSKNSGVPMYDEDGSIKPFLDYVNGISLYPISYKMKNSSGNDEFFRFYPVNVDTTISGLSIDEGSNRGMTTERFGISFTVTTEFNASGLYYYFNQDPELIDTFSSSLVSEDKIIPLFTIDTLHPEKLDDGWSVYTSPIYKVSPETVPDILDIRQLMNKSMIECIEYHKQHSMPIDMFMRCVVMKDNRVMDSSKGEYEINYDNYTLITKNCNPDSTYRIVIHINVLYINELLNDLLNLREEK